MSAITRACKRRRPESGYTLIETMIAMMLLSVVIAAAFGVVAVMQKANAQAVDVRLVGLGDEAVPALQLPRGGSGAEHGGPGPG